MRKALLLALVLVFALSVFVYAAPATAFVDVPATDPSYGYVQQLIKAGVIDDSNGAFNGNKTVTRYEMAAFVAKAIKSMDRADAANKVLIQKLAVEFEAQLEEMNVRLTAIETKANAVSNWFSPTMPKFSGEFNIGYSNGTGNYYAPYQNGTGTILNTQGNNANFDLNIAGILLGGYNMQYHGGFELTVPYLQTYNATTNQPSALATTMNWANGNVYIDGDLPGIAALTKAAYGANTTFAFGRVGYAPGSGLAVDSNLNGARVSNVFDNLTVDAYCGYDDHSLAYGGYWEPNPDFVPGGNDPEGFYHYGVLINPSKNTDLNGENGFDMYGQSLNAQGLWTGNTGYSAGVVALNVKYAIPSTAWTIKAGWVDVMMNTGASPARPYVGQDVDQIYGPDPTDPTKVKLLSYSQVASVTNIGCFQNLDLGVLYDDGYWHGALKGAMSPTYSSLAADLPSNFMGTFWANAGVLAEVHAGTTDKTKLWSYDGYLKYSNVGPFMSYFTPATTLGLGGVAYIAGLNFTPIVGSLWENSITYATSAIPSNIGTGSSNYSYNNQTVFSTTLHFYY